MASKQARRNGEARKPPAAAPVFRGLGTSTPPLENGCESRTFPGLRLAVEALLAGDMARVMGDLQKGLDAAEHAEFVASLA